MNHRMGDGINSYRNLTKAQKRRRGAQIARRRGKEKAARYRRTQKGASWR